MNIYTLDAFPLVSDEAHSSVGFSFYYDPLLERRQGILVYESQRDFLSTPRSFVIVRVELGDEALFCAKGDLLSDEQLVWLKTQPYGLYCLANSEYCATEDGQHFICYSPKVIFEFCAEQIFLLKTVYGAQSVVEVLRTA